MQLTVNTMKQASHYLLLCVLVSVGLSSCHKDIEEVGETTTTPVTQVDIKELIESDVVGYIYDENDLPMADVEVNILGNSSRTNEFGVFVFRNTDLDANGTYITATKEGYILGSDRIYPDKADVNHSYIKMLRLTTTTTVNGANGGNIVVQGGGIITFEANTIVNSNGEFYTGLVTVTAKRIAADDPDLSDVMPGGLLAEDKDGYTRVLGTLGMVAVELRDANGNELNLAEGTQATVQFPIAQDQQTAAPDQIALWSFDESKGLWIEEGFATREGNNYLGQVSHFSFWNCDAPFPLIHVCGTVLGGGVEAANLRVEVVADGIFGTAYDYTDSDGRFCGKMPKGKELTITVYYPGCQQQGFTFTVGPFDTDTELDPITLSSINNGLITGTVLCDGNPVPDASVVVVVDQQTIVYLADENGNYSFNTSIFGCEEIESTSIFAFNNLTNEASSVQEFDLNTDASIDLNTCGGCDMIIATSTGFLTDPCVIDSYFARVDVTDANGDVTYEWDNGSVEQVNNDISGGLYCVTVTDAEGCQEISCVEFGFTALADSLAVANSSCDMNNGYIQSNPYGGTSPYMYLVTGPSGETISTEVVTEDLGPGVYEVIITDANGCTVVSIVDIVELGGIPEFEIFQECGVTQLSISPNLGDYSIEFEGEQYNNFVQINQTGSYCFDITNSQGCSENRCLDVFVQEQQDFFYSLECSFPNYIMQIDGSVAVDYYSQESGESLSPNNFAIEINPLIHGYFGLVLISDQFCFTEQEILLPRYDGLVADGISPSCDDCEDGFINIELIPTAECYECNVGEVAIYDLEADPLLENDLSGINEENSMPSGQYYVIVTHFDTDCIIAHKTIEL